MSREILKDFSNRILPNERWNLGVYLSTLGAISISWWFLAVAILFGNRYGAISIRAYYKGLIFLPALFLIALFLIKSILDTGFEKISKVESRSLLLTCAAISVLVLILFPLALPAIPQQHNLQIISSGSKNAHSQGSIVEIRKLSYLDGSLVDLQDFELSGNWQIVGDTLISSGDHEHSVAELMGRIPGGVVLSFRYNIDAGQVEVIWDGEGATYDLFASQSVSTDHVTRGGSQSAWQTEKIIVQLLYFVGLLSILVLIGMTVDVRWPRSPLVRVFVFLAYAVIFASFVDAKFSYLDFSAERVFRDTAWYVETANAPLDSLDFWAGIRPFTFPLALKFFGITPSNYADSAKIHDLVQFQYWFSILAWAALAFAISLQMRKLWIRPIGFGIILYFSLNLEISIWDSLVLSESTSFSLFALLIAVWIFWSAASQKSKGHLIQASFLFLTIVVTVLYVFSRESNQYFVIFGALLFPIAGFLGKVSKLSKGYYLGYLLLFFGVVFLKNASFNISNLWQIHLFDHLAHRILPDQDALDFFVEAGLPVSESLMGISEMPGHEFHEYLSSDNDMVAVRDWIGSDGVSTYIRYLLSRPIESIIEPFHHLPTILSGNNIEYHQPRYAVPTIPLELTELTQRFYPRVLILVFIFVAIALLGVIQYILDKGSLQPGWMVVAVLLISLYPMMFIVWHGNPIEIERHAASIGVQLRLMGWMTVVLFVDRLANGDFSSWNLALKSHSGLEF